MLGFACLSSFMNVQLQSLSFSIIMWSELNDKSYQQGLTYLNFFAFFITRSAPATFQGVVNTSFSMLGVTYRLWSPSISSKIISGVYFSISSYSLKLMPRPPNTINNTSSQTDKCLFLITNYLLLLLMADMLFINHGFLYQYLIPYPPFSQVSVALSLMVPLRVGNLGSTGSFNTYEYTAPLCLILALVESSLSPYLMLYS